MKKIILALMIVAFSGVSFAEDSFPKGRTAAVGDEPNGDGQPVEQIPQSGVIKKGAGSQQPKVCETCQESNTLLSDAKRIAKPGVSQSPAGSTPAGSVDTSN